MLDPFQFEAVRRPLQEAETLPPFCYHDRAFYELESRHIFRKKWILIGRVDEWQKSGDYKTFNLFDVPFFVVRSRDGGLMAFSNSCRHRGSKLVSGEGTCSTFTCPYHSWTYDLEGRLRAAPGFDGGSTFDRDQFGLHEIRVSVWQSFVFVNFSDSLTSVADQFGDLGDYLAPYDLDNVVTVGRDEWVVAANWKSYVENSMEWLHHPTVHRSSILNRVATIERNPVVGNPGDYVLVQSRAKGVSRAVMGNDKAFPPVSTLSGAAREGSHYMLLYPYAMVGCDVDSIWYKQMIPEGPDRVRNVATYCFHKEIRERPDFDEIAVNYFKRFRTVVEEDNQAMALQFEGLRSPFAQPGCFSDREVLVHKIDNWILDQVLNGHA